MSAKLSITLLLATTIAVAEPMPPIESQVYTATGTQKEIIERAHVCVARIVRFDAFTTRDSGKPMSFIPTPGSKEVNPGGEIFVTVNPEAGVLIANSRIQYRWMMLTESTQSTVTIQAKDGRFKITHDNMKSASKNTGYMENDGYQPIDARSGLVKTVKQKLGELSDKIASCISQPAEEW